MILIDSNKIRVFTGIATIDRPYRGNTECVCVVTIQKRDIGRMIYFARIDKLDISLMKNSIDMFFACFGAPQLPRVLRRSKK